MDIGIAVANTLDLSLGIPVKDSSSYLADLFHSLENQTFLPREIIFSDDCSIDNSIELAKKFSRTHPDWNIHVIKNEKQMGIAGNYNQIADLSSSKWVQILDADDYLYGDYFSILKPYLDEDHMALVTGLRSNSILLNIPNILLGFAIPERLPSWLPVLGSFATRSGIIYRKSNLADFGFIDPAFDGSDILHFIYSRMLGTCAYIRKAKIFYRIHAQSQTTVSGDSEYLQFIKRIDGIGNLYYLDYYLRKRIFNFVRGRRIRFGI